MHMLLERSIEFILIEVYFLNSSTPNEPRIKSFQGRFSDSIELIEERGNKTARATDAILGRGCVLSGDFKHQQSGKDSQ